MANIVIKPLSGIALEVLHRSWLKAFSDYKVSLDLSPEMLKAFLTQNSVSYDVSVGAFADDSLIGFWMNGLRNINGKLTAYDSGTAIWFEYRNQGISGELSAASTEILKKLGVKEYVLEVMCDNDRAYNIYLKTGFVVTRKFHCYKVNKKEINNFPFNRNCNFKQVSLDSSIIKKLPPMEYSPSWQNTFESMSNICDRVKLFCVIRDDEIVAYGIVEPKRGRISQFGVQSSLWKTEVPKALLSGLCEIVEEKEIMLVNVDVSAQKTNELLDAVGFKIELDQYEMKKTT